MQVAYRGLPSDRRFGVEYEVSNTLAKKALGEVVEEYELWHGNRRDVRVTTGKMGWAETRRNNYWHVKYDSTCGPMGKYMDYGWEIASFIGKSSRDLACISGLTDWLKKKGVETNKNCGLHIHVDASDFASWEMGNLLARWIKVEHLLMLICPEHRWNNQYCRSLQARAKQRRAEFVPNPKSAEMFWLCMSPSDLNTHSNDEKKYTLNTVGYAIGRFKPHYDRQTVELRLPECLLVSDHVLNWTRLILNFVDYVKCSDFMPTNLDSVNSILEMLILLGLEGLPGSKHNFLIPDSEIYDTKIWLLKRIETSPFVPGSQRVQAASIRRFISQI